MIIKLLNIIIKLLNVIIKLLNIIIKLLNIIKHKIINNFINFLIRLKSYTWDNKKKIYIKYIKKAI
jgi:hypothetical protein